GRQGGKYLATSMLDRMAVVNPGVPHENSFLCLHLDRAACGHLHHLDHRHINACRLVRRPEAGVATQHEPCRTCAGIPAVAAGIGTTRPRPATVSRREEFWRGGLA